MDSRLLKYFITIGETENISKAAEQLHITQPTLSRQLKKFEDDLGMDLFVRNQHGLTLTETGRLMLARAHEIVALTDKVYSEIDALKENVTAGNLSIGMVEINTSPIMPKVLDRFTRMFPDASFTYYSNTGNFILDRLDSGGLDCAILINPIDISKYNYINLDIEEESGVYVHRSNQFVSQGYILPEDLPKLELVVNSRADNLIFLRNWLGNDLMDQLSIKGYYNLILNAAPLVDNNIYSMVSLKSLGHVFNQEETVFLPLRPRMTSDCVFVWKKKDVVSNLLGEFIKILKDTVEN